MGKSNIADATRRYAAPASPPAQDEEPTQAPATSGALALDEEYREPEPGRIAAEMRGTARATIAKLSKQPHVPVRLPLVGPRSKIAPSSVPVNINGAVYRVPRGQSVNVPMDVYRQLENAGYITASEAFIDSPPPRVIDLTGGGI